jgi:hypothetical protein
MPKRTQWLKARPGKDRSQEIFKICLGQRRTGSFGKRLRTYSMDELDGMSPAQLAAVKRDGWTVLPDLLLPHAPPCLCKNCELARENWRARTGKD